jgi:uncharacterized protein (DUF362 family)
MNRRTFLKEAAVVGGIAMTSPWIPSIVSAQAPRTRVAFVKTTNRAEGVKRAIQLLKPGSFKGKDLFIKPNFNSSDPTPGSTHPDTLAALLDQLRSLGAGSFTIADRSGMGNTREVMEARDVFRLGKEMNAKVMVLDELTAADWQPVKFNGSHWQRGFAVPVPLKKAGGIVQTCCLKTHRYGGHFTLSLKNSVGLAAKFVPGDAYNYMRELHDSPDQRRMIAEINTAYKPDLVVLDGVDAFVTGGPDSGKEVGAQVILAGTDRIAIDAVGVSLLRFYGTTPEVSRGTVFEQEQIARAVQLGLGVGKADQIELLTDDAPSAEYAKKIQSVLTA